LTKYGLSPKKLQGNEVLCVISLQIMWWIKRVHNIFSVIKPYFLRTD